MAFFGGCQNFTIFFVNRYTSQMLFDKTNELFQAMISMMCSIYLKLRWWKSHCNKWGGEPIGNQTCAWLQRRCHLPHSPRRPRFGAPGFLSSRIWLSGWQSSMNQEQHHVDLVGKGMIKLFLLFLLLLFWLLVVLLSLLLLLLLSLLLSSWWFQPIWKILVKMGIFPK